MPASGRSQRLSAACSAPASRRRAKRPGIFRPARPSSTAIARPSTARCSRTPSRLPAEYGKERKKWRIEVVLHGRNSGLTEVSFLHQHNGDKPAPSDLDHVRIDIFGRGNVAYRWAGEVDVSEAVDNFLNVEQRLRRGELLDINRGVLRGFSMGGAGTWHLGLHAPERWCVNQPRRGLHHDARLRRGTCRRNCRPSKRRACISMTPSIMPRTLLMCRSSPTPAKRTRNCRPRAISRSCA